MKSWKALVLGLLVTGTVLAGIPSVINLHIDLTPGNVVNTKFRNGDDGTAALPLGWGAIPNLSCPQGTPQSINFRSLYLTEPGAPSATISFQCTPTLAGGWSTVGAQAGNGLDCTYSAPYSGSCTVTATRNTNARISDSFLVSASATSGADTQPPAQPIGVTVSPDATGLAISFLPSVDPTASGQTWSGLDGYEIFIDGSGTALTTVLAPDTGIQLSLTAAEIGGSTGGSATQSGINWSIVSDGDGIGGVSELGMFAYQQMTSDFYLCANIFSLTGGDATNAHLVLMARPSTTANDFVVLDRQNPSGIRPRYRTVAGAATSTFGSAITQAMPAYHCLKRLSGVWSSSYSTNGNTFITSSTSSPNTMTSGAVLAGLFAGDGGSTAVTADVRNVILSNHPLVTYHYNITDGALHSVIIKAKDKAGNRSVGSASVSASAPGNSDITAPSVPTGLSATGTSQSTISLTWTASTDAGSGIRGYIPCVATISGGTCTDQTEQVAPPFTLSGLAASTARFFKVEAVDKAGNISARSTEATGTSQAAPAADVTPPTVPSGSCTFNALTGPCATGTNTTTFNIVANASTDVGGCGVADYRLYRSSVVGGPFTLVATSSSASFSYNSGGPAGTMYFFKETARDCASPQNESAQSNTFSGTLTSTTGGTLLLEETFTSTTLDLAKFHDSSDNGGQRIISAGTAPCTPPRAGPFALTQISNGSLDQANHEELVPNSGAFILGKTYWFGESICFGDPNIATDPVNTTAWYFVTQVHPHDNIGNPMMSFKMNLHTGNWAFQVLGEKNVPFTGAYTPNNRIECTVPVTLGHWTDVVMNFRFGGGTVNGTYYGNPNPGFWKVWIKDLSGTYVQCVDTQSLNYFLADTGRVYIKIGQYRGYDLTHEPTITSRRVHHDELRLGLEENGVGFSDVEPR